MGKIDLQSKMWEVIARRGETIHALISSLRGVANAEAIHKEK